MTLQSEALGGNSPPTLDKERLNTLADHIEGLRRVPWDKDIGIPKTKGLRRNPKRKWFNMAAWSRSVSRTAKGRKGSVECGTVGCIAGWARSLFVGDYGGAFTSGRMALGLSWEQADDLFYARGIADHKRHLISPHRAAKVLRHLAKTGEVDWSKR